MLYAIATVICGKQSIYILDKHSTEYSMKAAPMKWKPQFVEEETYVSVFPDTNQRKLNKSLTRLSKMQLSCNT